MKLIVDDRNLCTRKNAHKIKNPTFQTEAETQPQSSTHELSPPKCP